MGRRRANPVLAPIARWLWWRPRNLAIACVGTLAVLIAVSMLSRGGAHHTAASPPASATVSAPASAATPSLEPNSASSVSTQTVAPPEENTSVGPLPPAASSGPAAAAAAQHWATLWARPTIPASAWAAALTPLTFPDLAAQLDTVDPSNVPANSAAAGTVTNISSAAAAVNIPLTGGSATTLSLQLIWYPSTSAGHWLVSDYQVH